MVSASPVRETPPSAPTRSAAPAAAATNEAAAESAKEVVRPPSLSPSRAADFLQCPLLFRFRVIDKLPEPPNAAAVRGTLVHAVLERLFDLPAAERTPERALELLPDVWQRLQERSPEVADLFSVPAAPQPSTPPPSRSPSRSPSVPSSAGATRASEAGEGLDESLWLATGAALVRRWFDLEDPTRLEPAEREVLIEAVLPSGLTVRGYIDRLDVSPQGLVRVVDYKTGRSPGEGFEAKALFQMRFYALALWTLRGQVPAMLQLVYLGDGQIVRYAPTEDELRATRRKVEAIWTAIETAREQRTWKPRRSNLCSWCAHQSRCPEFGGTPPPLPETRTVLLTDHVRVTDPVALPA